MRTTTLGTDGPETGVLGLGCMGMSFGYGMAAPRDEETSVSVIRQAIDLGMTLIDTADSYGPYTNEELVGRALAGGHRERAVPATKIGVTARDNASAVALPGPVPNGRSEHIRTSIDESLRSLGTDHVDLYQLHRIDPETPVEESWGALAETVAAGRVRAVADRIGASPAQVALAWVLVQGE